MRPKINWFSPIFPAATDIAHYTNRVLADLAGAADVTIWTDQNTWDPSVEEITNVKTYRPDNLPWSEFNRADISIYNIGNNPLFHKSIWRVSTLHAGIVILHDFRLHHFFEAVFRRDLNDRDGYLSLMEEYYGDTGRIDAEKFWTGRQTIDFMATHYPLTELALINASGVIVHNELVYETLIKDGTRPVCYFPLPYPSSDHARIPARSTASRKPYRIVIFGYIGKNRRLDEFLRAFSEFGGRDEFVIDIYGKLWNERYVGQLCKKLNIKDLVTIRGFVPEDRLDDALRSSRLAVNLRYPTMGEASGSQLRIWYHALPSLVTETGWYSTLPKGSVAFIRPEHEDEDIKIQLSRFLQDPDKFRRMGIEGKKILEKYHSPKLFSKVLVEFIGSVTDFRKESVAFALATGVARHAANWLDERPGTAEIKSAAEAIYSLTEE